MGKKAAKKAAGGDGPDLKDENNLLRKKLEVLQYKIMIKDETMQQCITDREGHSKRVADLDSAFTLENDNSLEHTGEMQRQYKEMQSSFNERIKDLEVQVAESKGDIEGVREEIEKTAIEKDEIIAKKDEEIRDLSLKMETMAFEFADMLKETLDKMSQRIEITHSSWDRDASKPPLLNRLKEFSLTNDD